MTRRSSRSAESGGDVERGRGRWRGYGWRIGHRGFTNAVTTLRVRLMCTETKVTSCHVPPSVKLYAYTKRPPSNRVNLRVSADVSRCPLRAALRRAAAGRPPDSPKSPRARPRSCENPGADRAVRRCLADALRMSCRRRRRRTGRAPRGTVALVEVNDDDHVDCIRWVGGQARQPLAAPDGDADKASSSPLRARERRWSAGSSSPATTIASRRMDARRGGDGRVVNNRRIGSTEIVGEAVPNVGGALHSWAE